MTKYSEEEIDSMTKEEQIEFREKVLNSKYKKFYYELEIDGSIVTFKTKEEREEYKRNLIKDNDNIKHYTKTIK